MTGVCVAANGEMVRTMTGERAADDPGIGAEKFSRCDVRCPERMDESLLIPVHRQKTERREHGAGLGAGEMGDPCLACGCLFG